MCIECPGRFTHMSRDRLRSPAEFNPSELMLRNSSSLLPRLISLSCALVASLASWAQPLNSPVEGKFRSFYIDESTGLELHLKLYVLGRNDCDKLKDSFVDVSPSWESTQSKEYHQALRRLFSNVFLPACPGAIKRLRYHNKTNGESGYFNADQAQISSAPEVFRDGRTLSKMLEDEDRLRSQKSVYDERVPSPANSAKIRGPDLAAILEFDGRPRFSSLRADQAIAAKQPVLRYVEPGHKSASLARHWHPETVTLDVAGNHEILTCRYGGYHNADDVEFWHRDLPHPLTVGDIRRLRKTYPNLVDVAIFGCPNYLDDVIKQMGWYAQLQRTSNLRTLPRRSTVKENDDSSECNSLYGYSHNYGPHNDHFGDKRRELSDCLDSKSRFR